MGAQQTKDRVIPAGSTVRQTRKQPRNLKDQRIIGSNIFTEHSGENALSSIWVIMSHLGPAYVPSRHDSSASLWRD